MRRLVVPVAACVAVAWGLCPAVGTQPAPKTFTLAVLHMNDVYEISPLNRGTVGGLARVATLKKQLAEQYGKGQFLTVHAGDFLSPSALGAAKVNGRQLDGEQMVDVLKAVGIDYIILGNHEFDLKREPFERRLNELRRLRAPPASPAHWTRS